MANCKICGRPVTAGPVMHSECLGQLVTETAEQLCDSCPMERLMKLAQRRN